VIQSHVHVLQKRGLAHDFIVADLDNETNIDHYNHKNKNITSNILSTSDNAENKNNQGMYVDTSSGNNPIHDIESHASDYGGVPFLEEGRSSEALLASATLMESGMHSCFSMNKNPTAVTSLYS